MKKVSIGAAKQMRNICEQKLTMGLDLGDRWSWYCVLEEAGEVLLEQKLSTTAKAMREVFGGMARSRIALETGMHSPWVSPHYDPRFCRPARIASSSRLETPSFSKILLR